MINICNFHLMKDVYRYQVIEEIIDVNFKRSGLIALAFLNGGQECTTSMGF